MASRSSASPDQPRVRRGTTTDRARRALECTSMSQSERRRGGRDVDPLLIAALAAGATQEVAAERAGCSRATLVRRMADPGFRARVTAKRDHMLTEASARLVGAMS